MRARWVIVIVAVCLVAAVAAIAYAAGKTPAPEVIQAQRFELVDAEGKVLAELKTVDQGSLLILRSSEGPPAVVLQTGGIPGTAAGGGSLLLLTDEQGKGGVLAGASAEGSFVGLSEDDVLMQSPPGQERVGVGMIDSDAMRGIFVADEKSKARAALAVSDEGSPSLDLSDEKGRPRAGLMLLPDGTPDLVLFDKDAKVLWEAP